MTVNGSGIRGNAARAFLILAILASLGLACGGRAAGPEQRYPIKGKVVNVDKRGAAVTVAHEAIPGYMDAMTMPFKLKDSFWFDVIVDGDRLQATLVVSSTRSWLEEVVVVHEAADPSGAATSLEPKSGDEVPDFALINQDGKRITLRQYRGRALLLTFIYTRCPLPDYCPLMTEHFGDIEKALAAEPALYANTHLLSITVDPEYDTPQVLRKYAEKELTAHADRGRQAFAHWELATGSKEQVKSAATYFGMQYWQEGDQIIHSLRTALIGPDGKLIKLYPGNEWKPQDILGELHGIAGLSEKAVETHKSADTKPPASASASQERTEPNVYRGIGVVEEVNKEAATVQINHEDIKDLMPAMSMPFKVRSGSLLGTLAVGDHVEFRVTGDSVIISIKKR
ncbi:MAG: copper-binding protein [Acidobacteriota bacterium]